MPDHPSWPAELVEKAEKALESTGGVGPVTAQHLAQVLLSTLSGDLVPRSQAITRAGPNTVDLPPVDVDDLYDAEATDEERDAFMAALNEMHEDDGSAVISNLRSQADALAEALEFYADAASYEEGAPSPGALDGVVAIKEDAGRRAREALAYRKTASGETEG